MRKNLYVSYCYSAGSTTCFGDRIFTTGHLPTARYKPLLNITDIEAIKTGLLDDIRREQPAAHSLVLLNWAWLRDRDPI